MQDIYLVDIRTEDEDERYLVTLTPEIFPGKEAEPADELFAELAGSYFGVHTMDAAEIVGEGPPDDWEEAAVEALSLWDGLYWHDNLYAMHAAVRMMAEILRSTWADLEKEAAAHSDA